MTKAPGLIVTGLGAYRGLQHDRGCRPDFKRPGFDNAARDVQKKF